MNIRLKYAAEPANAPLFAADMVTAAEEISQRRLDYSPRSLRMVDEIVEELRQDGPPVEMIAETLFGFGCYVGQVFVHNGHGQWARPTAEQAGLVGFPFIVRVSADSWLNPIGKAFKRYENGEEDSLQYYYGVMNNSPNR